MSVRIRLKRLGRKHRPYYRICAMESSRPRDGRVIEELGSYDPLAQEADKQVTLDKQRAEHWVGVGAQVTETVFNLLKKQGIAIQRSRIK